MGTEKNVGNSAKKVILINVSLRNAWSKRFEPIWTKHGSLFGTKQYELELLKTNDILDLHLRITFNEPHSGCYFSLGIIGINFGFTIHDTRH